MSKRPARPNENEAASRLSALGNATRLRLFRLLVKAGPEGLNVGDLQRLLAIPASTLAHHLSALTRADLVLQQRHGREVLCLANYDSMNALVAFLTDACCSGVRLTADSNAA